MQIHIQNAPFVYNPDTISPGLGFGMKTKNHWWNTMHQKYQAVLGWICCCSPTAFYTLHHIKEPASQGRRPKYQILYVDRKTYTARKNRLHPSIQYHNHLFHFSHTLCLCSDGKDRPHQAVVISTHSSEILSARATYSGSQSALHSSRSLEETGNHQK